VTDAPTVVAICGSLRFAEEMHRAAVEETLAMKLVLLPFVSPDSATEEEEWRMALLSSVRLAMAHEVLVVDCTMETFHQPYHGPSTQKEIDFARQKEMRVRFRHDEYSKGLTVYAP
jgi:hypothetical protein